MSRRPALSLLFVTLLLLLLASAPLSPDALTPAAAAKDKPSVSVHVDCAKGESVNDALSKNQTAQSLFIEISGLCHENVVITRDRVTLHGTDPASDGIEAEDDVENTDAAVWVRGAQNVALENLKLTGGFAGLIATNANLPSILLTNCRLEGNSAYGMQLQTALVEAHDSTFGPNGNINAALFGASRLQCSNCTLSDPQGGGPLGTISNNVIAFASSHVLFDHCAVTNGPLGSNDGALLQLTDCSIAGLAPSGLSVNASSASSVFFTRVQVKGAMRFAQGANAQLFGVTQTALPNAPPPTFNSLDDNAYVRVGDAPPAAPPGPPVVTSLIGMNLRNFSKFSMLQNSTINGNLVCNLGADAVCTTPSNISGTTANCTQCHKP
jgi:hypothetical protein